MVDTLTESLKAMGYACDGLHGDLSQNQRDTVMNLFRSGRISILIATDVAARGIDVSGVEAVFNFDIPEDIEYYVHRIGRTGRAGKSGKSFTLVGGREMYKLREIEKVCHTKIEERRVPSAKEITRVKSQKVFSEVIDIIENGDISSALSFVNQKVEEGEYTAEQLAAGFMKLKMGADIEDLVLFEKSDRRDRRYGRGSERDGKSERGGRGSREGRGSKEGRFSREGRFSKDGRSARDGKPSRDGKPGRGRKALRDSKPGQEGKENSKAEQFPKPRKKKRLNDEKFVSATSGLDESLIASIKADRSKVGKDMIKAQKEAEKARTESRREKSHKPDSFENVGHLNIKGEGSTKAWYMGQDSEGRSKKKEDSNTMNVSKAEKKAIKAENKKRSIDYLQDVSDLVMESFGKRKNRGK